MSALLYERRFYKEPGFTAAGTADHKDIFIPRIFRLLRAAVHGEPFSLCQRDIVLKYWVGVGLNIVGISP
jgi:hypothetical protein